MKKGCGWALVALVTGLSLSVGLVANRWDFGAETSDLEGAAREYRAAGLPWTAAELAVPVSPEENAAPLLRQAIAALPPERVELQAFAPALSLAHEAAKRPKLNLGLDLDLGFRLNAGEYSHFPRIVHGFVSRAIAKARKGDDDGALADLEDACRIGTLLRAEPLMRGIGTGERCVRRALSGAIECLAIVGERPKRLTKYQAWLARPIPFPDYGRAWRGEIYLAVAAARALDNASLFNLLVLGPNLRAFRKTSPAPPLREGFPEDPLVQAFMARGLRENATLARATKGLRVPLPDLIRASRAIQRRNASQKGFSHALDPILFPTFDFMEGAHPANEALRAVAIAFIDALRLHAKTGKWPEAVETPDPLGKGPLRLRQEDGRFRLYSVGRNHLDDGGRTWAETHSMHRRTDDLVAVYPPFPPEERSRG